MSKWLWWLLGGAGAHHLAFAELSFLVIQPSTNLSAAGMGFCRWNASP